MKHSHRKTAVAATLAVFLILMVGCGERKSSVMKETRDGQVVVDSWDREVLIPENVEKVACLYAFTGHVTTMLGRGRDIVAVVPGLKRDRMLNELNPQLEHADVCSLDGVINIEELLKTAPDLVFLKGESAMMDSEVEKLERFGLPYVVIEYNSMKEQMEAVEIIAAVLGREEKGREYVSFYEDVIKKGRKLTKDLGEEERIRVYHSVNEAVRTDAPDTLPAEWLEVCGVENVSVGEELRFKDNKYFASLEQIYLWDPEVIICNEAGVPGYMMSNEKWAGLQAVRSGDVHQIPIGISRWGHPGGMETPLAILWTIGTIYPELKEKADLRGGMDEFYSRFFGFTPDEETVATILDGSGMRLPKS